MQSSIVVLNKVVKRILFFSCKPIDWIVCYWVLYSNGVKFSSFRTHGIPKVNISLGGKCIIGSNFTMNNRESSNPIGRFHACSIVVGNKGELVIGKNVGMSSTAIVCHDKIEIGDHVNIGGNVVLYDTDFHSLDSKDRMNRQKDIDGTKTNPIKIGNNVFVGAHSTILKGVSIGNNSVIGACSVVSKDVPENEIWAGNPAKCIKTIRSL